MTGVADSHRALCKHALVRRPRRHWRGLSFGITGLISDSYTNSSSWLGRLRRLRPGRTHSGQTCPVTTTFPVASRWAPHRRHDQQRCARRYCQVCVQGRATSGASGAVTGGIAIAPFRCSRHEQSSSPIYADTRHRQHSRRAVSYSALTSPMSIRGTAQGDRCYDATPAGRRWNVTHRSPARQVTADTFQPA